MRIKTSILAGVTLFIIIFIGGLWLTGINKRDAKLLETQQAYTICVIDRYDVTPLQYKEQTGYYPKCK